MSIKKGNSKTRIVVYYILSMVAILVGVFLLAYTTSCKVFETSRATSIKIADGELKQDAGILREFMNSGVTALTYAAQTVDMMVQSQASDENIQKFMSEEMERAAEKTDSLSGTVFGFINDKFIHGGIWRPSEGFVPTRRLWYKEAIRAKGKVVVGKPFIGSRITSPIISFSKSLSDRKSVLAYSLPVPSVSKMINGLKKDHTELWLIMDKEGLVITSSGEIRQGTNCLSAESWGKDEEKLAREILISNESPFGFIYNDKHYMVFSALTQSDWYLIKLHEYSEIFGSTYKDIAFNILIYTLLYFVMALLCTYAFWNRLRLVRFSKSKSKLLDSLGKELRTPLNGILSMTRIILREAHNENIKDYVKNVQIASTGVISVVNDVQEIASIESGEIELDPAEYGIYPLLKECFDTISPKATAKNLHFSLECDPDIPTTLWGDESRIRQIIVNLLSNSIMYTEVGEVHLSIGFDVIPSQTVNNLDEYINLQIVVKDSGIGVRDETQDTLFGSLFLSEKQKPAGTRFSLNLTKQLISMCNGEIIVKSRYGEGATYMVNIPQLVLNIEPMGDFATRYKAELDSGKAKQETLFAPGARILAVDDTELNLKVIRGLLKETRVQIDTVRNGSQCLEMVQAKHYDLILLDNYMPMMDGRDTYERMKRLPNNLNKNTPVIILTAGAIAIDKESYLSAGFADYIPKPLMEEDLLRALKWYLPKQLILTREDLKTSPSYDLQTKPAKTAAKDANDASNRNGGSNNEKVIHLNKKKTHEIEDELELDMVSTPKPIEKMSQFSEFLNVKSGLNNCINDESFYREMLEEFVSGNKLEEMRVRFEQEDWQNYQILVHSLKSTALTIGADSLSEKAKGLEMACKEKKFDFIHDNHQLVMDTYASIIHKIGKGLED